MMFSRRQSFLRHIETAKHKRSENVIQYVCECGKKYIHKQSLYNHRRTCTSKILEPETASDFYEKKIEDMTAKHEKEKEELRTKIEGLLEKVGTVNIENQTNNIQINYYGCENLEYLTDKFITEMMKIPYQSIPRIIKQIHFHPSHPENHNVKITNKKLPYASVYKNDKWELENKRNVIEDLMRKGYGVIEDHDQTHLSGPRLERLSVFKEKFEKEEMDTMKQLYQDTELILLNG